MNVGEIFLKLGVRPENMAALTTFTSRVKGTVEQTRAMSGASTKARISLGGLNQEFQKLVGPTAAIKTYILGAVSSLTYMTKKVSDVAFDLAKFSNLTGLSSVKLEEWQQRAAVAGVSADELASSVEALQRQATEIRLGRGNIAPWALLGIDPRQDPFAVLSQLQNKLKSFSPALGKTLAEDVGLTSGVINFLKEAKNLPQSDRSLLLSEKEIQRLKEYNLLFNQIWDNAKRAVQKFAVTLLPITREILVDLGRLTRALVDMVKGLEWLAQRFQGFGKVAAVVLTGLAAYIFPLTAAITGLILLMEDIATYMRGGKSMTGEILKYFGPDKDEKGNTTKGVFEKAGTRVWEGIKSFGSGLGNMWDEAKKSFNQTNNINIQIDGSKDPKQTGTEVKKALDNQTSAVYYQMATEYS